MVLAAFFQMLLLPHNEFDVSDELVFSLSLKLKKTKGKHIAQGESNF